MIDPHHTAADATTGGMSIEYREAMMRSSLQKAATDWISAHGVPSWATGGHPYSTAANQFLWLAEEEFVAAVKAEAARRQLAQMEAVVETGPPRRGFHLYRLWGDNDRLLYIGVSTSLRARLGAHRRRWGHLIREETWEAFDSAEEMLAAETVAIREEHPAFNKAKVG